VTRARLLLLLIAPVACGRIGYDGAASAQRTGPDARPTEPASGTVAYPEASSAPLVLNGSAQRSGTVLQLTGSRMNEVGSAFLPRPYAIRDGTSFRVQFSARSRNGTLSKIGGDGVVFVWQSSPAGGAALGGMGGGLGYSPIAPSLGVELDEYRNGPFDPNDNHVAVDLNGVVDMPLAIQTNLPVDLNDASWHYIWIDYDGGAHRLDVYLAADGARPAQTILTATVDLHGTLGDRAYVGFTSSTGGYTNVHEVGSFSVDYRY
jgi:hypothetical protein